MTSDHHVGAVVDEELRQIALDGVFAKHVFNAPVHRDYEDFRSGVACLLHLPCYPMAVDQRHLHSVAGGDAVGAVGIVEEAESDSVDVFHKRHLGLAVGSVVIRADMVGSEGIEGGNGASGCLHSGVKAVVVGRQQHIESGIHKGLGIAVGRAEAWIAAISRTSPEGHFEIDYGIVGFSDGGGYPAETLGVVVGLSAPFAQCLVELGLMLHGVACKQYGSPRRRHRGAVGGRGRSSGDGLQEAEREEYAREVHGHLIC